MPICIECREPVTTLWTRYAAGSDASTGHNIRLSVCRKCGQFCDKYVEHDFVVIFIDLVLIKPQVRALRGARRQDGCCCRLLTCPHGQVYRHLLYNTMVHKEDRFHVGEL